MPAEEADVRPFKRMVLMGLGFLVVVPGEAQVVQHMTPDRIREAIALGSSSKDVSPYRVQEKARWSWPPLIAVYTTPFLRVALAANEAKKRYQSFSQKDVTPEMLAPEIDVFAFSHALAGGGVANVVTVVLLPHNSKDRSHAVHAVRTEEIPQEFKNLFGFAAQGRGLEAIFPLNVWNENSDIHVVFDEEIPGSMGPGAVGGCSDCKSRIYLKHVR